MLMYLKITEDIELNIKVYCVPIIYFFLEVTNDDDTR